VEILDRLYLFPWKGVSSGVLLLSPRILFCSSALHGFAPSLDPLDPKLTGKRILLRFPMTGRHLLYIAEFLPSILSLAFVFYVSPNAGAERSDTYRVASTVSSVVSMFLCMIQSDSPQGGNESSKVLSRLYYSGSIVTLVIALMTIYLVLSDGVGPRG